MANHQVKFDAIAEPVHVSTGQLLTEAAHEAGIDIAQPCGGQGRCGRCAVQVVGGSESRSNVRSRSTLRLSAEDVAQGYVLACQAVVEGDASVHVPPQEKIERRLTTDRTAVQVTVPPGYNPATDQTIRRIALTLTPPSMDDQTDDWSRLQTAVRQQTNIESVQISLPLLRKMGTVLREGEWEVTAVLDVSKPPGGFRTSGRLVDVRPGHVPTDAPLWGAAIDIGTTTVSVWLVDLLTGEVKAQAAEYNRQIRRGEDVISRIIFASKNGGEAEMHDLVAGTINGLLERAVKRATRDLRLAIDDSERQSSIVKATITGNSTMMHLLLGIPAGSIRLSPFVTAVNHIPLLTAKEIGLAVHPEATVDCIPGVASYVGADISAGVLSSGMDDTEQVSLFMDIGTNGEIVLGSHDWLVTCACSAGPAFEGAGVAHGMRATRGAIEEVWIDGETYEPTCRVIGDAPARGLCGSGLISLLAEMFLTGVVDKGGHFNASLPTDRIRKGEHGLEYVVAWQKDGATKDIAITAVDVDNLLRAKAAIYAGFAVLAESVGLPLAAVEQVLVGGSFGKYINVEKAVEIGLLPDMAWENFHFLGNTSVMGAYYALLDYKLRDRIADIASRMTYIELSADNSFFEAFTSALFLPHTDTSLFPSVAKEIMNNE
ncbi:MAG: DUF4445 domain-containing protein [Chloroflexi bacterium]|nr:DUF4445 domain-containing protein [Chloroflexota bacterium]